MLPSDIRSMREAYRNVYEESDLLTNDLIEEVVEELIEECLEFGYDLNEAAELVEEAATEYLMELNPYAPAGSKQSRAYQKSTTATKRGAERKAAVKGAVERVKSTIGGVKAAAGIAGSIAKDELGRAGRSATHAAGKAASAAGSAVKGAAGAVSAAASKKKAEVKQGVKGLIGRGLRKAAGAIGNVAQRAAGAASRLGEEVEQIDEIDSSKIARTAHMRMQNLSAAQKAENSARDAGASMGERSKLAANTSAAAAKVSKNRALSTAHARSRTRMGANEEVEIYDVVLEYLMSEGHADTIAEAEYIMTELDSEMVNQILETSFDPRGRPASGPMNVYKQSKPNTDPAFQAALKSHKENEAKKTPAQRKAELDAYIQRQRENK